MVEFIKAVLNPFWWFDLLVIKPLMLLLSAIFWLPVVAVKWAYPIVMQAWNSKLVCWFKPTSLLGKIIVYASPIWMYKYDISLSDLWEMVSRVWAAVQYVL